jgi:hypothetical protein
VIIRAWAEPGVGGDELRARITLVRPLERDREETFTVAGLDAGLALVRAFLNGVEEAARSRRAG